MVLRDSNILKIQTASHGAAWSTLGVGSPATGDDIGEGCNPPAETGNSCLSPE